MKNKNIKLYKKNPKIIPIFFATDDNYVPFLEVALRSLIKNASKEYKYVINVLNTGLNKEKTDIVKRNTGLLPKILQLESKIIPQRKKEIFEF